MKNTLFASALVLFGSATITCAFAGTPKCEAQISLRDYESRSGKLAEISAPDLASLPLCNSKKCFSAATIHTVVHEDGSVSVDGLDHTWGNVDEVIGRIEKARFMPPKLAGKAVCVLFDFGWSSVNVHRLGRLP